MIQKPWDAIWINAAIATMREGGGAYRLIANGAIVIKSWIIAWIGSMTELMEPLKSLADEIHDAAGACITPVLRETLLKRLADKCK